MVGPLHYFFMSIISVYFSSSKHGISSLPHLVPLISPTSQQPVKREVYTLYVFPKEAEIILYVDDFYFFRNTPNT
jgi:hypothetical protein